jgi:tetratricopeptide (TPR) repeat protein
MDQKERALTNRAKKYWDDRKLSALSKLRSEPGAESSADVLYFVGLALNALNKRRDAIECWRKATDLDPQNDRAVRTLAYELMEQAPVDAAELFYRLVGMNRANADDFTCLAEIRIKQDRLGEARRWLDQALRLDPQNSLALVALATLYAQVRDSSLALDFLQKAARTEDIDLSDLAGAPDFAFLWHDPRFEKLVSPNGRK